MDFKAAHSFSFEKYRFEANSVVTLTINVSLSQLAIRYEDFRSFMKGRS